MVLGGKLIGLLNYCVSVNWQDQEGWRSNVIKCFFGYLVLGGYLIENDELDICIGVNCDFYLIEIGLFFIMFYDIFLVIDGSKYLSKGDVLFGLNKKVCYNSELDFMYNCGFNVFVMYKYIFSEVFKLMEKLFYIYDDIDYFGIELLDYFISDCFIYDYYYMIKDKQGNDIKKYICLDFIYYSYLLCFLYIVKIVNN